MIQKKSSKLGAVKKSEILIRLLAGETLEEAYRRLSAPQMRELRDFLEEQIVHLSADTANPMTTAAYFHTARIEGVSSILLKGSSAAGSGGISFLSRNILYQTRAPTPAMSRMMLATLHSAAPVVSVLPTSGSCGQLLV